MIGILETFSFFILLIKSSQSFLMADPINAFKIVMRYSERFAAQRSVAPPKKALCIATMNESRNF